MHHWSDNLFFGRRANGDVRIVKFASPPQPWPGAEDPPFPHALVDLVIPSAQWVSIVASVSKRGENTQSYMDATIVHNTETPRHHELSISDAAGTKDRLG